MNDKQNSIAERLKELRRDIQTNNNMKHNSSDIALNSNPVDKDDSHAMDLQG